MLPVFIQFQFVIQRQSGQIASGSHRANRVVRQRRFADSLQQSRPFGGRVGQSFQLRQQIVRLFRIAAEFQIQRLAQLPLRLTTQFRRQLPLQDLFQIGDGRSLRTEQHCEFRFEQLPLDRFRPVVQRCHCRSRLRIDRQAIQSQRHDHVVASDQVPRPRREFMVLGNIVRVVTAALSQRRWIKRPSHRKASIAAGRNFETCDSPRLQRYEEIVTDSHTSTRHRPNRMHPQRLDRFARGFRSGRLRCGCFSGTDHTVGRHRDRTDVTLTDQHNPIIRHRADAEGAATRDSPQQLPGRCFDTLQLVGESRQQ